MTKKEAESIEKTCDYILGGYLKCDCSVSMALSGHLKIQFGEQYITISKTDLQTPVWIKYNGFWKDVQEIITDIQNVICDNRVLFERLMWSYEHGDELEEK